MHTAFYLSAVLSMYLGAYTKFLSNPLVSLHRLISSHYTDCSKDTPLITLHAFRQPAAAYNIHWLTNGIYINVLEIELLN